MHAGDIVYSIFTMLVTVLFIAGILSKRMKKKGSPATSFKKKSGDSIYDSSDAHRVVQRLLSDKTIQNIPCTELLIPIPRAESHSTEKASVIQKTELLSSLKKAVIWKEILSAPLALRDPNGDGFH